MITVVSCRKIGVSAFFLFSMILPLQFAFSDSTMPRAFPPEERAPWPAENQDGDNDGDKVSCETYKVAIKKKDKKAGFIGESVFHGSGANLSCLDRVVDKALDYEGLYNDLLKDIAKALRKGEDIGRPKPTSKDDVRDFIRVWSQDALEMTGMHKAFYKFFKEADDDIAEYLEDEYFDGKKTGYINSQCEPIRASSKDACGQLDVRWVVSPVSLVWDEDASLDAFTLVRFPLDPSKNGWWYTWKASRQLPLLVIRGHSSAAIQNGTQLFGNYTFGGAPLAMLRNATDSISPPVSSQPWKNGYEPLATLDLDGDGALRGDELKPLGLWFDDNQDGISDPQEVKSLEEMQVTAIFFTPDRRDEITGDISASLGFERMQDGAIVRGASIDWYSHTAPSKHELLSMLMAQGNNGIDLDTHLPRPDDLAKPLEIPAAKRPGEPFLDGIWRWKIVDEATYPVYKPQGILTIRADSDGTMRGHSISEVPLQPNANNIRGVLASFALQGAHELLPDGRIKVTFALENSSGVRTLTTAFLSTDGRSLTGSSRMGLRSEQSSEDSVEYEWTATRYIPHVTDSGRQARK